jgi:hypothetical protein
MNNLNVLKEFLLRNHQLLSFVRPTILIYLLEETKKELIINNQSRHDFVLSKNVLKKKGDDTYQQNAIDFANTLYEWNTEETEKKELLLTSLIEKLNRRIGFNNNLPIVELKLSKDIRKEIEWLFDIISEKDNYFKKKCFDVLKNLIFGELIRINNQVKFQEPHNSAIQNTNKKYLELIFDFENNYKEWMIEWIDKELPNEDFF